MKASTKSRRSRCSKSVATQLKSPVQLMRANLLAFLAQQTAPVTKTVIKDYLGLTPWKWDSVLEQALRSRKIRVDDYYAEIGLVNGSTMRCAASCKLYSLMEGAK